MTGLMSRLQGWLGTAAPPLPFIVDEIAEPDAHVDALFARCFGGPAPRLPFHYIARRRGDGSVAGYVHYTRHEPGIYLCGGLCVDARVYRSLAVADRAAMQREGSLSRWMSRESIARLPDKKAVFAYTGNLMSIRDALALDFQRTTHQHLMVQWHAASAGEREGVLGRVAALGPF